jgi:hypothetical protein
MCDRQCKSDCDRGIYCIAARTQNLQASIGSVLFLRDDHCVSSTHRVMRVKSRGDRKRKSGTPEEPSNVYLIHHYFGLSRCTTLTR